MATPKKVAEKIEKTKTYIMRLTNGEVRKVTVPETWRVTFGATIPYAKGDQYGRTAALEKGYSVRIYSDAKKTNLEAVFGDVRDFRKADIAVEERVTERQSKTIYEDVPGQGRKGYEVEACVSRWCDPLQEQTPETGNKFLVETQKAVDELKFN